LIRALEFADLLLEFQTEIRDTDAFADSLLTGSQSPTSHESQIHLSNELRERQPHSTLEVLKST